MLLCLLTGEFDDEEQGRFPRNCMPAVRCRSDIVPNTRGRSRTLFGLELFYRRGPQLPTQESRAFPLAPSNCPAQVRGELAKNDAGVSAYRMHLHLAIGHCTTATNGVRLSTVIGFTQT